MSVAKLTRSAKKQRGEFLTPRRLAELLVADLPIDAGTSILEPSMGDGSFLLPLARRLAASGNGRQSGGVWGAEIDGALYRKSAENVRRTVPDAADRTHLFHGDFFTSQPAPCGWVPWHPADRSDSLFGTTKRFDLIVGNPPFGGSINPALQDALDRHLGLRDGLKIKKETYAWFVVRCVDLLRPGGRLRFICSDTILTIPTMRGLREFLRSRGDVDVARIDRFSDETTYPMVTLDFTLLGRPGRVRVDGRELPARDVQRTRNASWGLRPEFTRYFGGSVLGDYMTASSGMTIGRNELFLRPITDGKIVEPMEFTFEQQPITLADELAKARLNTLGPRKVAEVEGAERRGTTQRVVVVRPRPAPLTINLPHPDYRYYNKASSDILYAPPAHAVYWRDEGDAVLTFKRTGNWYLRGVGGMPYFGRSGLTWQLIAPRLRARFLPDGYILDSGAPCAFLNPGVPEEELWLILGWTLTDACNAILKNVINHTRNIQSKDFERLPYPYWLTLEQKGAAIAAVRALVDEATRGRTFTAESSRVKALDSHYEM